MSESTGTPEVVLSPFQGGVRIAVLWGLGFGAIGFVLAWFAVSGTEAQSVSQSVSQAAPQWQLALSLAVRFAIFGIICGTVFWWITGLLIERAAFARFGRIPVALGGAVGTAVFVPLFMQTMNLLSGDGLVAWSLVLDDSVWAFFFGGGAALGSLELARRWTASADVSE
jgi:hypothetical protein